MRVLAEAVLATGIDGGPGPAPTFSHVPAPEQASSESEVQTEQLFVQSPPATLPMTAATQMPPPVAQVDQPAFRIISTILIALGLMGGLAFMQHKLQTQPKPTGATSRLVLPMDKTLDSNGTAIEEAKNHA